MSREDEIRQGLREESGCLTFPLDVLEYARGHAEFKAGLPPPRLLTSASYDLGRSRAREDAELKADLLARFDAEDARRQIAFRQVLKDRPDLLAEYDKRIAEIRSKSA